MHKKLSEENYLYVGDKEILITPLLRELGSFFDLIPTLHETQNVVLKRGEIRVAFKA